MKRGMGRKRKKRGAKKRIREEKWKKESPIPHFCTPLYSRLLY